MGASHGNVVNVPHQRAPVTCRVLSRGAALRSLVSGPLDVTRAKTVLKTEVLGQTKRL